MLVRGFKSRAESLALEMRGELKLATLDPLNPLDLADLLAIPVISLADLDHSDAAAASVAHFLGPASSELSAFTITLGSRRLIVENPRHASTRRANSLCHELSHVLLEHEGGPVFGMGGCRRWNDVDEEEADWQAGALLVPGDAALSFARRGVPLREAADQMGVSPALMTWRLNQSGARKRAERERQRRTP